MAAQLDGQPRKDSEGDEPVVCRPCAEPQTTRPTWWQRLTNLTLRTAWRLERPPRLAGAEPTKP